MAASLSGVFSVQQFTDLGAPLVGGRLYTYEPGTTTHKTAYTDAAGLIPHTYTSDGLGGQYIALNSRGELPAGLFLTAGGYDLALKTAQGATIWTRRANGPGADAAGPGGSAGIGFMQSGTGAVAGTVQDELREILRPEQFGAVGDGATDDTAAFNRLDARLAAIGIAAEVVLRRTYLVNPKATTVAIGSSQARLFALYTSGSVVTGGGVIKINGAIDYTVDHSAGDQLFWSAVQINADHCTVERIGFDGNGKHTASGHNPAVVNVRFQVVASFGVFGSHRSHNAVLGCWGTDIGGQAVSFQYQDHPRIVGNKFHKHSGIAVSVASDFSIDDNYCEDCYDAPFVANPGSSGDICRNSCFGTSNGSGIDVVGCTDVDVFDNHIQDCAGSGIWVHYSGQQSLPSTNIKIHDNVLRANATYTGAPIVGEITLGKTDSTSVTECTDVEVYDNTIIVDGAATGTADRAILIGLGVARPSIRRNRFRGTPNSSNYLIQVMEATDGIEIIDNAWEGTALQAVNIAGAQPTNFRFARNRNIKPLVGGSYFQDTGVVDSDGSLVFGVTRNIGTSAVNVLTIVWSGGNDQAQIEVAVAQQGDRGAVIQRMVARGNSGVTTTMLEDVAVSSYGTSPPVVAEDIGTTGQLKVTVASGTGTNESIISIRVRTRVPGVAVLFR